MYGRIITTRTFQKMLETFMKPKHVILCYREVKNVFSNLQ